MNAEHELKVHVERIVRPIRADEKDKLKMREELYAHALDALEHEQSSGVSEAAAARRAVERLGDAATARQELQATVAWGSRNAYWLNQHLRRPEGVSLMEHATRFTIKSAIVFAAYVLLLIVPLKWDDLVAWNFDGRLTVWFLVAIIGLISSCLLAGTVMGHHARELAERRYAQRGDRWKAAGLVLLSATMICVLGWCFTFVCCFDLAASLYAVRLWLPLSWLLGVGMLAVAYLDVKERRPLAEWLALDLDESVAE